MVVWGVATYTTALLQIQNDRIIVLDQGEVVEVGTPKELFHNGGMFREMVIASGLEDRMSG